MSYRSHSPMTVGPLKLTTMTSHHQPLHDITNTNHAVAGPPAIKKKSLGVRKNHATTARYQLPITNGNSITTFFKKSGSGDATAPAANVGMSFLQCSPSPECTPESSPALIMNGTLQFGSNSQSESSSNMSTIQPPLPSFEALLPSTIPSRVNSMWDSTPPTDPSHEQPIPQQPHLTLTRGPPPAPTRAPKKAARRPPSPEIAPTAHHHRSIIHIDDDEPLLPLAHSEETESSYSNGESPEHVIPFSLNLYSQPDQAPSSSIPPPPPPPSTAAPSPVLELDGDAKMDDEIDATPQPQANLFGTRTMSMSSDVVIQASQDEDENHGLPSSSSAAVQQHQIVTADDFQPLHSADGVKSACASQCSTPKLLPMPSPVASPSTLNQGINPSMLSFRAFNESLTNNHLHQQRPPIAPTTSSNAAVTSIPFSRTLSSQTINNDMPPPSSIPVKSRTIYQRTNSHLAASNSFADPNAHMRPVRQSSLNGSQSGLPPTAPRLQPSASQNNSSFFQTNLNHLIRSNSNLNMGGDENKMSTGFASFGGPGSQLSQTQCLPNGGGGFSLTQTNSMDSCQSMFCTPQDQPIRERTAFEMSEELFLQRENVAWDHQQQGGGTAGGRNQFIPINPHQPLTAAMRYGSASGSNGFMAPPLMKKARLTMTSGGPGLESMQALGSNLPTDDHNQASSSAAQPVMTHPPPHAPVENPFLSAAAATNGASASSATSTNALATKNPKKRGFNGGDPTAAAAAVFSSSATSRLYLEFEYLKQFGLGCFGFVFLVRHRLDGLLYAVKKSKSKIRGVNSEKLALREIQILAFLKRQVNCPSSILRYETSWIEEGHLYIQTEWCEGGSLASILKKYHQQQHGDKSTADSSSEQQISSPFNNDTLFTIALQLSQALAFMHAHHLVHLDVKPDNILEFKAGEQYRLADFGLACSASDGSSAVLAVGDKRYLPNEALDDEIADLRAVDLFSLGCTLYELACGMPFELPMSQMEMARIRHGDIEDVEQSLDPVLYEMIRSLLHSDPSQRRTAASLVDMLEAHIMQ